jgi:transcriptional regulator with XRE-family HTH domain
MTKTKMATSRPTIYLTNKSHIGPGLRQIRVSQDLTQLDVASAASMDPTHMGAYERNHTVPTAWKLLQILGAHRYALVMVPLEECPEWVG